MNSMTIGLDIAKLVFQVHGEDRDGCVVLVKRLSRSQMEAYFSKLAPALIGIEACGSAHHWGRVLRALGHDVRLIPASYVKPFVERNKTDARDAAAICAALRRPNMRFVPIKSVEEQGLRGLERARELLVKQRTQLMNCLRGLFAELGIVAAQGLRGYRHLLEHLGGPANDLPKSDLPESLAVALRAMADQVERLEAEIAALETHIVARAKSDPLMRRLASIPGVGPITAHAVVAAIGDGARFSTARDFAAWCGLTPLEHSSGGKRRARGISRQGEQRLRKLFALGASTLMRNARSNPERANPWQSGILSRRPIKVAVLAQAARTARVCHAVLVSGQAYQLNYAYQSNYVYRTNQAPASRPLATAPLGARIAGGSLAAAPNRKPAPDRNPPVGRPGKEQEKRRQNGSGPGSAHSVTSSRYERVAMFGSRSAIAIGASGS
jgi:transposase